MGPTDRPTSARPALSRHGSDHLQKAPPWSDSPAVRFRFPGLSLVGLILPPGPPTGQRGTEHLAPNNPTIWLVAHPHILPQSDQRSIEAPMPVPDPAVGDGPGSGRGSRSGAVLLAPCESGARIQRWADHAEFVSGAICASRAARRRSSVWAMPSRRSVRRSRRPQTRSIMNHMGRLTGSMTS